MRGVDLFQRWIDKQTHPNTGALKSFNCRLQLLALRDDVETALRCNFFALFWDEADFVRNNSQSNIDNLGRVAHFQIQLGHDVLTESIDIAVLYVTAVAAQMSYDALGAGALAHPRRRHWIGLRVFRIRHSRITRLPQRRDVIDINSQSKSAH